MTDAPGGTFRNSNTLEIYIELGQQLTRNIWARRKHGIDVLEHLLLGTWQEISAPAALDSRVFAGRCSLHLCRRQISRAIRSVSITLNHV